MRRVWIAGVVALGLLCGSGAWSQGIESIMSPGSLIQGHAKWEDDCKQCHVKFDRKAQDGLCMACHKEVGADVRAKTGFHGKNKPEACRSCHTDHKGSGARIALRSVLAAAEAHLAVAAQADGIDLHRLDHGPPLAHHGAVEAQLGCSQRTRGQHQAGDPQRLHGWPPVDASAGAAAMGSTRTLDDGSRPMSAEASSGMVTVK